MPIEMKRLWHRGVGTWASTGLVGRLPVGSGKECMPVRKSAVQDQAEDGALTSLKEEEGWHKMDVRC
jgi:hypothetical protein